MAIRAADVDVPAALERLRDFMRQQLGFALSIDETLMSEILGVSPSERSARVLGANERPADFTDEREAASNSLLNEEDSREETR